MCVRKLNAFKVLILDRLHQTLLVSSELLSGNVTLSSPTTKMINKSTVFPFFFLSFLFPISVRYFVFFSVLWLHPHSLSKCFVCSTLVSALPHLLFFHFYLCILSLIGFKYSWSFIQFPEMRLFQGLFFHTSLTQTPWRAFTRTHRQLQNCSCD